MRESRLLEHIYARSRGGDGAGVVVGPGDDCAAVRLDGLTLLTVDQLVEGRHYDASRTSLDQVARKAVARSVSDVAAMGGTPVCALVAACLREGFDGADELFDRVQWWGESLGCPVVGGDIASAGAGGVNVLTVTVAGRAHASRGAVLRSGAREGDVVCVTGRLGGSLESGRHLSFEPRVREGRELCDLLGDSLTAMIDVSDGLGRDAGRVARASGVRVEIDAGTLPMHEGVSGWRRAAGDGEDYELLFTVRAGSEVPRSVGGGTKVTVIGRVTRGEGCVVIDEAGGVHEVSELGWEHGS